MTSQSLATSIIKRGLLHDELAPSAPHLQVATCQLRALLEVSGQHGISAERLFGRGGAQIYDRLAERFLPCSDFQTLLERATELSGDPALGLHCALRASESSFGLMTPLIAHAPTLRRGLELLIQFHPLLIPDLQLQLTERGQVARLHCQLEGSSAGDRSFAEWVVSGLVRTLRAFLCTRNEIRCVSFRHKRPVYAQAYAAAFSGAERFGQAYTGVEFLAAVLDRPHLHDAELHALMLTEAERSLWQQWRPSTLTDRVRGLLSDRSPAAFPDMPSAARELGLSVRTLRRHLDEEQTTYRALTQSLLQERARALLCNPMLTLQEVAHKLGFSDATAFHRACKRWINLTPAQFRAQLLSENSSNQRVRS
jgi:AraC-like DNA-binding protein